MDMQDKEFDDLFRAKLDNFEAEPTGQVWYGITEGLDGKRRYRALLPWLSIAASVTVLVAAGVLFIPKKGADPIKPRVKDGIVKTTPPAVVKQDTVPAPHKEIIKPAASTVNVIAHVKPAKATSGSIDKKQVLAPENPAKQENIIKQQEQPILAVVEPKQDAVSAVVPGNETPLITKQTISAAPAVIEPIAAVVLPPAKTEPVAKPKRRVHGIGGFLNTVIAAVDKRKDKIIEFSNSDDDESSNISAVNLGVLKFKKDKDK